MLFLQRLTLIHETRTLITHFTSRSVHTITKNVSKKIKMCKFEDSKDVTRPLCVILGWGGAKQKNLRKYSEIFESKGYNIITVSPTLVDILLFPEIRGKKISDKILETIEKEFDASKTVFFQFSNGGCGLYYFICEDIYNIKSPHFNKINIVGSVFDSCPVVPKKENTVLTQKAFTVNIKNPIVKNLVWYSIGAIVPFLFWFNPIVKLFMKGLTESPLSTPQLFLYSKSDDLAPYKDISDFINSRKIRGVKTMQMLWEDSPHVSHLKHDEVTYTRVLNEFLDQLNL